MFSLKLQIWNRSRMEDLPNSSQKMSNCLYGSTLQCIYQTRMRLINPDFLIIKSCCNFRCTGRRMDSSSIWLNFSLHGGTAQELAKLDFSRHSGGSIWTLLMAWGNQVSLKLLNSKVHSSTWGGKTLLLSPDYPNLKPGINQTKVSHYILTFYVSVMRGLLKLCGETALSSRISTFFTFPNECWLNFPAQSWKISNAL